MAGGTVGVVGARGTEPVAGDGSRRALDAGDKVCGCWGFLGQWGWVADMRMFSIGASSSS